ncbi:invasion associated locus B family protein [Gluconacetobacter entanii]|uniref:invasion associated locus B family protein n=1 Tax=Gluconacetobacter entanii TaxID=108528 RepID=UPI001C9327AE|nr:invasion associated locus B family protein [Gluconacetobacter entanii]MBY4639449.1 invasion associated locus B family protein [Gluconacetobacter entanii]MCW4579249.1 invasion associated locus B family protein [Gluconacetobacter entanii]MCW4582638.1 invasion associated locus B family protein [Gluconacetobacter entanii]MCW4586033.1 invasion associated locus B family protein [Gluconacetobacter entanii]
MNRKLAALSVAGLLCVAGGSAYFYKGAYATVSSPKAVEHKDEVAPSLATSSEHILPGGASSLNETYQDWRVVCQQQATGSRCAIVLQEFNSKTRQRILSVELTPHGSQMQGVTVLPFGAALSKGVSLIADDRTIGSGLTFSTCVPAGCLVPLNLDQRQLGDLESAKKVEVKFSAVSGQDINIPLSNKGLDKAVRRLNTVER